jgi:hypothetical protein
LRPGARLNRRVPGRYAVRIRLRALLLVLTLSVAASACGGEDEPSFEGGSTEPVSGSLVETAPALLERVAVEEHDGFSRVVLGFRNHVPGYRVEYVEPPLHEDGSGDVVEVAGDAIAVVRMATASGFDVGTGDGVLVYEGPRRLEGAGVVRELARTGDFEGVLTWAVGLGSRVPFRASTLADPPRLVVDFAS